MYIIDNGKMLLDNRITHYPAGAYYGHIPVFFKLSLYCLMKRT